MILYVTENRSHAVRTGPQGTYDICEISPRRNEDVWKIVANRDYQNDAREIADRLDRQSAEKPHPLDPAAVEAADRRDDTMVAILRETERQLAEARASLKRVEQDLREARDDRDRMGQWADRWREDHDEAVARAEKAEAKKNPPAPSRSPNIVTREMIEQAVLAEARAAGVPLMSPPRVPEAAQAMRMEIERLRRELEKALSPRSGRSAWEAEKEIEDSHLDDWDGMPGR